MRELLKKAVVAAMLFPVLISGAGLLTPPSAHAQIGMPELEQDYREHRQEGGIAGQALAQGLMGLFGSGDAVSAQLISPLISPTGLGTLNPEASREEGVSTEVEAQVAEKGTVPYMLVEMTGAGTDYLGDFDVTISLNDGALSGSDIPQWQSTTFTGVSGVSAGGYVRCNPGTWTNCSYFMWALSASGTITAVDANRDSTSGLMCTNRSCSYPANAETIQSTLTAIGGGAYAVLQQSQSALALSAADIEGTTATYYGMVATNVERQGGGRVHRLRRGRARGHVRSRELGNTGPGQ